MQTEVKIIKITTKYNDIFHNQNFSLWSKNKYKFSEKAKIEFSYLVVIISSFAFFSASNVLGLGINGKVVQCTEIKTQEKCALKILDDNVKSRREIDLHWRASGCKHIVNIKDVYENTQKNKKCLLVVMEWWVILSKDYI